MVTVEETQSPQQDFFIDMASRLRATEGRYNLLRDRVLLINQNMIEEWKHLTSDIRIMSDELKETKVEMFRMKETMKHLLQELARYARKEDVTVLEKYINLWNPMKFTTEGDVKKIIEATQQNQPEHGD